LAIRKRKWKTAQGVKTAWSYVFDAPGSTRDNRKQIFESGFESKKEAADAEVARAVSRSSAISSCKRPRPRPCPARLRA
jgi:hypothetical protein